MAETILVKYDRYRRVVIDGSPNGFTNEKISVSRGPHRVTLGVPVNYVPTFRRPNVVNTTPDNPMELEFTRVEE
jgi:hypothetical protein